MSNLDYLFLYPSVTECFEGFDYHLGAAYVRAFLQERGVATMQFLHPGHVTLENIADQIAAHNPRIIGFTCYDANYFLVKLLASRIRRHLPGVPIVCGGPTATFSDETILSDCPQIDVCVRYFGESAALELLAWARGERPIGTIPGISYRRGGRLERTAPRSLVGDLRSARALFDSREVVRSGSSHVLDVLPDPYLKGMIPPGRSADVGIVTSRGCTFPCTYCSFSTMSQRRIHFHSDERVLAVLRFLDRRLSKPGGEKTPVPVHDDNFSLDAVRFRRLLTRITESGFQNIVFRAMLRADSLDDAACNLLRKAGFVRLSFGLESAVPRVLGQIRKVRSRGGEADDYREERAYLGAMERAVASARRAGIRTSVSIILGCPGETEEDGRTTLEFVRRLRPDWHVRNTLAVHAGTELAETCEQFGISVRPSPGRVLPFRTTPAYDIARIPSIPGDLQLDAPTGDGFQAMSLMTGNSDFGWGEILTRRITGTAAPPASGSHAAVPIIGVPSEAITYELLEWFAREMPMAAGLWVLHSDPIQLDRIEECLAACEVPVPRLNSLRERVVDECLTVWRINELSPTSPDENTKIIEQRSFRSVDWHWLRGLCAQARRTVALAVQRPCDVEALCRFIRQGRDDRGAWSLPPPAVTCQLSVQDSCRWGGRTCPAARGDRFLADAEGRLYPCLRGEPVGRVGESLSCIRNRTRAWFEGETARRGCRSCAVSDFCSQCLFPAPLAADEYCRLRKECTELAHFVDGLRLLGDLRYMEHPPDDASGCSIASLNNVEKGLIGEGPDAVELSRCLLLSLDSPNTSYLYQSRRRMLYRISGQ